MLRDSTAIALAGALAGCLTGPDGALPLLDETPEDASPEPDGTPPDERVRAHERAIHERVNEARRTHDVGPLAYNEDIAAVARAHSADMAERDYFAHVSPEDEGPRDRLAAFFPRPCRGIGENIADVGRRPDDAPAAVADRVVNGWLNSPGHRENLLREAFDEEGIGVTITAADRVLATQNFCATGGFG